MVLVGETLAALGDALLGVVGVTTGVVVPWASAGLLGCISASQLRNKVRPAASTNATTAIFNNVLVLAITTV